MAIITTFKYTILGKERLPYVFYKQVNFDNFIETFGSFFDDKVPILDRLANSKSINRSAGSYLDRIGIYFNFPRPYTFTNLGNYFILSYGEEINSSLTYGNPPYSEDMKPMASTTSGEIAPLSDEYYRKYLTGLALLADFDVRIKSYVDFFQFVFDRSITIEYESENIPANTLIDIEGELSPIDTIILNYFKPLLQPLGGKVVFAEIDFPFMVFDFGDGTGTDIFSDRAVLDFT